MHRDYLLSLLKSIFCYENEDIQTALTIIGRRKSAFDKGLINLSFTRLIGANLKGTDLEKADLREACGLECEQLKLAKNWHNAYRDEALACDELIPESRHPIGDFL